MPFPLPFPLSFFLGFSNRTSFVFFGWIVSPNRSNRFGRTCISRRASSSSSHRIIVSSANRIRYAWPFSRGFTTSTNHLSITSCRYTFDSTGEITPPCGAPSSAWLRVPSYNTHPAHRFFPFRRQKPYLTRAAPHTPGRHNEKTRPSQAGLHPRSLSAWKTKTPPCWAGPHIPGQLSYSLNPSRAVSQPYDTPSMRLRPRRLSRPNGPAAPMLLASRASCPWRSGRRRSCLRPRH